MAWDKTDLTDTTPLATSATTATREPTSRQEIEAALDDVVREWLRDFGSKSALPGWHVLFRGAVNYLDVGQARIPTLTEKRAVELVALAETNAHAFDAASYLAGMQFGLGHLTPASACPLSLRMFGARRLCGEITRPAQLGRPRAQDVPLRLKQYLLCRFTAERAPLPLTRNRDPSGPASFSACDAVAEAFTRAGRNTTQAQLASLCYDDGFSDLRALAEGLDLLDFGETE